MKRGARCRPRAPRTCQLSPACGNMREPGTRRFKARGRLGLGMNHMMCDFPPQTCLLAPVELGWILWKEPRSEHAWVPAAPATTRCIGANPCSAGWTQPRGHRTVAVRTQGALDVRCSGDRNTALVTWQLLPSTAGGRMGTEWRNSLGALGWVCCQYFRVSLRKFSPSLLTYHRSRRVSPAAAMGPSLPTLWCCWDRALDCPTEDTGHQWLWPADSDHCGSMGLPPVSLLCCRKSSSAFSPRAGVSPSLLLPDQATPEPLRPLCSEVFLLLLPFHFPPLCPHLCISRQRCLGPLCH